MYNENEKKTLSKATVKLLRKSIKDIKTNEANTSPALLNLHNFTRIAWNNHEQCKKLTTLVMAGMWKMFDKEIRK